ncbi:MAG: Crp/Fnr family transcriptional regulator, partial [Caldimonas sp.]
MASTEIDPSDPDAREAQTFPSLPPEMAARIASYSVETRFEAGTSLFSRGDRGVDFFLVLEGLIEIFDLDEQSQPQVFAEVRERQFAGELDLFNDRPVLVSGRIGAPSRIVRVKRADFRRLVSTEPDIG